MRHYFPRPSFHGEGTAVSWASRWQKGKNFFFLWEQYNKNIWERLILYVFSINACERAKETYKKDGSISSSNKGLLITYWVNSSPELSQSLLTNAFLFSSRNWLGMRPALPPSFTWLAWNQINELCISVTKSLWNQLK